MTPIKIKKKIFVSFLKVSSLSLHFFICSDLFAQTVDIEEELAEISEQRIIEINQEIETRRAGIEQIQSNVGIYDQSLIEAYWSLAELHRELDDYESASAILLDALQIARINLGLYSAEQIQLLRQLIENQIKAKDWHSADDFYELEYLISSRAFSPRDSEYLDTLRFYGAWKLRVIQENLFNLSGQSLILTAGEISSFYSRVISKVEQETGLQNKSMLDVLYAKTQVDMTLARYVASMPYTNFQGTASPFINQTRCRNMRNPQGQVVRQCYSVQVENPRYRQSQREAKRFALSRHTRAVSRSIGKLESIRNNSTDLTKDEKQNIDSQISLLVIESEQLLRGSVKPFLF